MNLRTRVTKWWEAGGNTRVRRAGYPLAVVLAGFFVFAMLRGPQGVLALVKKREDIQHLQMENARKVAENEKLRIKVEQIKGSQSERDNVVRRELNLALPGETIFIIKPKK